jgi:DNA-binding CsgD family transcriptional regulator
MAAMGTQLSLDLPPVAESSTVVINARCTLRLEAGYRVVAVSGLPVHHYSSADRVAEAYAMVMLVDGGFATQREVARAFGFSERTVRRHQGRYADAGMAALETRSGWHRGRRRVSLKRRRVIAHMKGEGLSNREIARRLGISENAVRKQVGPTQTSCAQLDLPGTPPPDERATNDPAPPPDPPPATCALSDREPAAGEEEEAEQTAAAPFSLDADPTNRIWDRLLAAFGFLDDAAPLFADAKGVSGAGVLFAVPALVASGLFAISDKLYGHIGPAFYGLRTTMLTLVLMALWRIKRPEGLKEHDPATLGRVLGLDRAPEVKTLRRKLTRLAAYHRAEELGRALAHRRVDQRGALMGFLYVDGHVRAYHGKRKLPKTHVARIRLAMPATTDYWVNDRSGEPLLVLTAPANAGLVKMLSPILDEVRRLVGERRVTIVFDRGGWSPKLFRKILSTDKFDILTYRKGKSRRINQKRFQRRRAKLDGRWVHYHLHDQAVRFLQGKLRLRQVTRLSDDGHQTQVLTSRWDLRDIEVAYRMFERWRQENFFKYMREEFLLDALVDYHIDSDDPTRTVPNPERRGLDKEVRAARAAVAKIEKDYGVAALDNPETRRPTMRGFKIANAELGNQLRLARNRLDELLQRRRALPTRVEVRDLSDGAVIKLATERKHLTNLIKMIAYQAESDLLALLGAHYARAEHEGRTLLHELFRAPADLEVGTDELRLTLRPLSSPHRTKAVEALCQPLNDANICFPGTRLPLRFAVHPPPLVGLAFPGPRTPEPDS